MNGLGEGAQATRASASARGQVARYASATAVALAAVFGAAATGLPAFLFEHVVVLLVVALAMMGGRGPAITAAIVAGVADNLFARAPVGRPAITGVRDVVDLAVFLGVAVAVGWLVDRMRSARSDALAAAAREHDVRTERDRIVAAVAHDLAAPLAAIQGTIQFARDHG